MLFHIAKVPLKVISVLSKNSTERAVIIEDFFIKPMIWMHLNRQKAQFNSIFEANFSVKTIIFLNSKEPDFNKEENITYHGEH